MLEHLLYLILIGLLVAATITDLKERLIYDRFIVLGLLATLIIRLFSRPEPWWNYVCTGLGVFIVLYLIAVVTGERSIGGGDVKLFAMLGLAVGCESFFWILMFSHILAALYMLILKLIHKKGITRKSEFPFAPFILAGILVTYLFHFML